MTVQERADAEVTQLHLEGFDFTVSTLAQDRAMMARYATLELKAAVLGALIRDTQHEGMAAEELFAIHGLQNFISAL